MSRRFNRRCKIIALRYICIYVRYWFWKGSGRFLRRTRYWIRIQMVVGWWTACAHHRCHLRYPAFGRFYHRGPDIEGGGEREKRRRISVGRMNLSRVGSNRKRRANLLRRVKLSCQVGGKLGGWVGRKNGKRSESGRRIFIQFDRERIRMNHLAVDVEGKKWKVSRSISRQSWYRCRIIV